MIILWNSAEMTVRLSIVAGDERQEFVWEAGRTLARDMLAYMRDRLAGQRATFSDIEAIGVFRGPGSYTGLRIGLTVMNTLASSLGVPIVGAVGDAWEQECLARISAAESDGLVLPDYGGEAHVTKPRK